jgi:hypothetical protein
MAINSPDRKRETKGTGINDHCTETAAALFLTASE